MSLSEDLKDAPGYNPGWRPMRNPLSKRRDPLHLHPKPILSYRFGSHAEWLCNEV